MIVDDHADSVVKGQEANMLWIGNKVSHYSTELTQGTNVTDFIQKRNRLAFAFGVLDEATTVSSGSANSLLQSLSQIQWTKNEEEHRVYKDTLRSEIHLYQTGARAFHAVNTDYTFGSALSGITLVECIHKTIQAQLAKP